METIKLNNDQVFEIIPMGIETNIYDKIRKFSFLSDLGYGGIETAFNTENISKIIYYSASNDLLKTYTDCLYLKALSKEFNRQIEDGVFANVYTVELTIS